MAAESSCWRICHGRQRPQPQRQGRENAQCAHLRCATRRTRTCGGRQRSQRQRRGLPNSLPPSPGGSRSWMLRRRASGRQRPKTTLQPSGRRCEQLHTLICNCPIRLTRVNESQGCRRRVDGIDPKGSCEIVLLCSSLQQEPLRTWLVTLCSSPRQCSYRGCPHALSLAATSCRWRHNAHAT